jgi:hypothetical protein
MQQMWMMGLDWDDESDLELKQKALQWLHEIPLIAECSVPRWLLISSEVVDHTIHIFVDASQEAYGAVAYAVASYNNDEVFSKIVASRSRVAPLKLVSIPRLELMAAVLGVKLMLAVTKALGVPSKGTVLWSDSMNVLFWIKRNYSRNFKPFVGNRINFIQEHTLPTQWLYVPTEQNSADLITRETLASSSSSDMWMSGPAFLLLNANQWNKQPTALENACKSEMKNIFA